jgi:hypothetical protein
MSITITRVWQDGQDVLTSVETVTETDEGIQKVSAAVDAETADVEVSLAFAVAQLAAVYILSDQDVTLETNSASVPDDTIALKADTAVEWTADGGNACPITVDVTGIYLSNAGLTAATVKIRVVTDATP